MIFLLGGAPRIGKSLIAQGAAARAGAQVLSTDELCTVAMAKLSAEDKARLFPIPGFSGNSAENTIAPEERAQLQIISARSLRPAIEAEVSKAAARGADMIIEGVHLIPEVICELSRTYRRERIQGLVVGSMDKALVLAGMAKDRRPENWLRGSDRAVLAQVSDFVVSFSEYLQEEAAQHAVTYIERRDDFDADTNYVLEQLLGDH